MHLRRHVVLLSGVLPARVGSALRQEASLWKQDLELQARKAADWLQSLRPDAGRGELRDGPQRAAPAPAMDPELARLMLRAPVEAAQQACGDRFDQVAYERERARLLAQELPFWRERGLVDDIADLSDPAAIDLLSYTSYKAILRQIDRER